MLYTDNSFCKFDSYSMHALWLQCHHKDLIKNVLTQKTLKGQCNLEKEQSGRDHTP